MDAEKILRRLRSLEGQVLHMKNNDNKTKYQVVGLFKEISKLINYRIPMEQIILNKNRTEFQCPRCKTKFVTEYDYIADDYSICPECGQLYREIEERKKE